MVINIASSPMAAFTAWAASVNLLALNVGCMGSDAGQHKCTAHGSAR